MKKEICDFCLDPNPVRYYKHPMILPPLMPITFAEGEWAACRECARLHEAGEIASLVQRVVEALDAQAVKEGRMKCDWIVRETLHYVYERIPREGLIFRLPEFMEKNMQLNCSNCKQTEPMPEGFWHDWKKFLAFTERHGHTPMVMTTICSCGAVCAVGPALDTKENFLEEQSAELAKFLAEHEQCEAAHA